MIAKVASRQEGNVARRQLLELGVSARAIDYRVAVGRLRPRFRGVYAVGHEATGPRGCVFAAVLAMAPAAAASHWTAAILREITDRRSGVVHVTCTQARRPQRGLFVHRAVLPAEDVALVGGIPTTSAARTLLDLSATCDERALRRIVKRAEFERLTSFAELGQVLARYPRKQGRRTLARIVGDSALATGPTRSEFEDRFLRFCAEHGLPIPETNAILEVDGRRLEVDCLWRNQRPVVELDGYGAHGTATVFEAIGRATAPWWRPDGARHESRGHTSTRPQAGSPRNSGQHSPTRVELPTHSVVRSTCVG